MPYCELKQRARYNACIQNFQDNYAKDATAGEVTYFLTALIHSWIKKQKWCYCTLCIAIGILFCTAFELYRKVIGPYEEKKRIENGGVSDLDEKSLTDVR